MSDKTFSPGYGTGQTFTTGASSAGGTIAASSDSLALTNLGTVTIYIRIGGSAVAATIADYPLLSGNQVTVSRQSANGHISHISPDGAGSLHVMAGAGF